MKRRSFLKAMGGAAGSYALLRQVGCKAPGSDSSGDTDRSSGFPRRVLGRTGEKVSIVGFPGGALARHDDQDRCTAAIHDAFERGVNYFDVAPAYGRGSAETRMGIGLQGIDRSRIFLACKTGMRDKEGARQELETSLKRLKTDHFDLYQMHCLWPEEAKQALGPGGAIETFLEAKEQGKVRFFGFSAHTTKGGLEAMNGFRFDTVMFPINFIEYFQMGFGKPILELAKQQGAAVLAIKPMCGGSWAEGVEKARKNWYRALEDARIIDMAMRFTLSQEPVAAGIPPSFLDLLDKAIPVGQSYRPITEAETQELRELAKTRLSLFKRYSNTPLRAGSQNNGERRTKTS